MVNKTAPDFIVPFPYSSNIRREPDGSLKPVLSVLSEMSLDAAATLWRQYPDAQLVVGGEACYPGYPTTTDLMFDRAQGIGVVPAQITRLVPGKGIAGFNNTYEQAEAYATYFGWRRNAGKAVAAIALDYHAPRVRQVSRAYGLQATVMSAERILHDAGDDRYEGISVRTLGLLSSEQALLRVGRVDPRGLIARKAMRRIGPRLVDVADLGDGKGRRLVNMLARDRLAQVSTGRR